MLNTEYREQAITDLEKACIEYSQIFSNALEEILRLYDAREKAVAVIKSVDIYATKLAHKPRNFSTAMEEIVIRYTGYEEEKRKVQPLESKTEAMEQIGKKSAVGAVGGMGVATSASQAALAVAMTFGTTSTGVAIDSLAGAAAVNSAFAWLGGGAVVAGGGGMAAGEMLLGLTGPVCWILGGSLAGSLYSINKTNVDIAKMAEDSIDKIKKQVERIKEIIRQVRTWREETVQLSKNISRLLHRMKHKTDCNMLNEAEMNDLTALFNDTEVLSKLLSKKIEE